MEACLGLTERVFELGLDPNAPAGAAWLCLACHRPRLYQTCRSQGSAKPQYGQAREQAVGSCGCQVSSLVTLKKSLIFSNHQFRI